jgi:hypothetical protein
LERHSQKSVLQKDDFALSSHDLVPKGKDSMRVHHLLACLVAWLVWAAGNASAEIIQSWNGYEAFVGSGLRGDYLGYTDRNHPFVDLVGRFSPGVRVYRDGHIEYPLAYLSVWPAGTGTTRFSDAQYTMRNFLFEVNNFQISHHGFLDFTGRFDGVAAPGHVNVTHTFTSPTTQSLMLGNDRFVVSVFPSVVPSAQPSSSIGQAGR